MNSRLPLKALLISALLTGGAAAMEPIRKPAVAHCSVVGGEKIPAAAGGPDAICREIGRALGRSAHAPASVVVQVRRSHLSAKVTLANGRTLPDIGYAVSDAPLSERFIKDFAAHVAATVHKAA